MTVVVHWIDVPCWAMGREARSDGTLQSTADKVIGKQTEQNAQ